MVSRRSMDIQFHACLFGELDQPTFVYIKKWHRKYGRRPIVVHPPLWSDVRVRYSEVAVGVFGDSLDKEIVGLQLGRGGDNQCQSDRNGTALQPTFVTERLCSCCWSEALMSIYRVLNIHGNVLQATSIEGNGDIRYTTASGNDAYGSVHDCTREERLQPIASCASNPSKQWQLR